MNAINLASISRALLVLAVLALGACSAPTGIQQNSDSRSRSVTADSIDAPRFGWRSGP